MVERHLEELEAKVHKMIEMVRKLREEKAVLERRLSEMEGELLQWQDERGGMRKRIERILEDLDALESVTNARGS
jgi:septal ring factor EnvC (AmiA/AmiB activator)